jgi:hypothetical protein
MNALHVIAVQAAFIMQSSRPRPAHASAAVVSASDVLPVVSPVASVVSVVSVVPVLAVVPALVLAEVPAVVPAVIVALVVELADIEVGPLLEPSEPPESAPPSSDDAGQPRRRIVETNANAWGRMPVTHRRHGPPSRNHKSIGTWPMTAVSRNRAKYT